MQPSATVCPPPPAAANLSLHAVCECVCDSQGEGPWSCRTETYRMCTLFMQSRVVYHDLYDLSEKARRGDIDFVSHSSSCKLHRSDLI